MKPRVVVCSANRNKLGQIFIGARHHDHLMNRAIYGSTDDHSATHWEQGFVDQHGVFMDRQEAWKVAEAAGQIKYRCGGDDANGGTLYSENLY